MDLQEIAEYLHSILNSESMYWMTAFSILMFLASAIVAFLAIMKLPADYFLAHRQKPPTRSWILQLIKNLLGFVLALLGVAMLVLPGQGLLTILIALIIMDFPGKKTLETRLVRRPLVFNALNTLRQKRGHLPFKKDWE